VLFKIKIIHLENQMKNQFEENKTKYDSLYIQNEELNNKLLNIQSNYNTVINDYDLNKKFILELKTDLIDCKSSIDSYKTLLEESKIKISK
jgi:hypothetical protein